MQPSSNLLVSADLGMHMFQNIGFEKLLLFGTLYVRGDVAYRHLRRSMLIVDAAHGSINDTRMSYEDCFEFRRRDLIPGDRKQRLAREDERSNTGRRTLLL